MAQIDTSGGGGRHESKVKAKKMSTNVDLTPMVDLAFLLITFFMLTTTMSKPVAMQLAMPKPIEDSLKEKGEDVKASQVLTIILDKDDVIWYYEGIPEALTPETLEKTNYGATGIRQIILDKQKKVNATFPEPDKTICLIKTTKDAVYKNIVDILDEMDITKTKIFAIQNMSAVEDKAVAAKW
jgi:biopolymer transport protein ExbD